MSCRVYSFNKVLALDESNATAHHYLGRIQWQWLQNGANTADVREACLRHLIEVGLDLSVNMLLTYVLTEIICCNLHTISQ